MDYLTFTSVHLTKVALATAVPKIGFLVKLNVPGSFLEAAKKLDWYLKSFAFKAFLRGGMLQNTAEVQRYE